MIDDGWLHYDAYGLPIASGKMDRRVADALPCKHTREMRRIADFNVPDNRPKSDLKINANDRQHADMSFQVGAAAPPRCMASCPSHGQWWMGAA